MSDTNDAVIPSVAQIDAMSCWAACLAWWLKALRDGRPSWTQLQAIAEYDKHTDETGGLRRRRLRICGPPMQG